MIQTSRPGLARAMVSGVLILAASAVQAVDCGTIKTWSNVDAAQFPVPAPIKPVVNFANFASASYTYVDGSVESQRQSTLFMVGANPASVDDRVFGNTYRVVLNSFATEAEADAVYRHDVATFAAVNPVRWNYTVMPQNTPDPLIYYLAKTLRNQKLYLLGRHHSVVIHVTVESGSIQDTVQEQGLAELTKRVKQAVALIEAKCGLPLQNRAPSVGLSSDSGTFSQAAFQREMAMGRITLVASDPNGVEDLDWSSFKLLVEGVDKTAVALRVVASLQAGGRLQHHPTATSATYVLQVDPDRLVTEHNFFNIAWNGTWSVGLRICDRSAACAQTDYRLYFGPFLEVSSFTDERCAGVPDSAARLLMTAAWGNNGFTARTYMLVALGASTASWATWTRDFWSLAFAPGTSTLTWFDSAPGLLPVQAYLGEGPTVLRSGTMPFPQTFGTATRYRTPSGTQAMPSGGLTLAYGAADLDTLGTPYWDAQRPVTLCAGR